MKPKIVVYLPVIHQGYLKLFKKYKNADIFIANESLINFIDQEFDYLRKEIRAISPTQAEISLKALLPEREICLVGANDLMLLDDPDQKIILPKEDIFVWLAENYLKRSQVIFETSFLRWNRHNSTEKKQLKKTKTQSKNEFTKLLSGITTIAKNQLELSSDWWRQVGAVAFAETTDNLTKIIAIAHNQHLPSPYTPYIDSDPRNSFHKGEKIDLSTAIHAEAAVIAYCAKKGISLKGKSLYVSTFPCPVCAKQIAVSGISKLYFSGDYSMLDGERILKNSRIEIFKLDR